MDKLDISQPTLTFLIKDNMTMLLEEYINFIEGYFTTWVNSRKNVLPLKLEPFQREVIQSLFENNNTIVRKHRRSGVSTAIAAFVAAYLIDEETPAQDVYICSPSLALSKSILDDIERNLYRVSNRVFKSSHCLETVKGGHKLNCVTSTKFCRGSRPTLIIVEEAAFMDQCKVDELEQIILDENVKTIITSTPSLCGDNPFDHIWYDFQTTGELNRIDYSWYENPRFNKHMTFENKETGEKITMPTIDKDGNVPPDKEYWKSLILDGFIPTSPWRKTMDNIMDARYLSSECNEWWVENNKDNNKTMTKDFLESKEFLGKVKDIMDKCESKQFTDGHKKSAIKPLCETDSNNEIKVIDNQFVNELFQIVCNIEACSNFGEDYTPLLDQLKDMANQEIEKYKKGVNEKWKLLYSVLKININRMDYIIDKFGTISDELYNETVTELKKSVENIESNKLHYDMSSIKGTEIPMSALADYLQDKSRMIRKQIANSIIREKKIGNFELSSVIRQIKETLDRMNN